MNARDNFINEAVSNIFPIVVAVLLLLTLIPHVPVALSTYGDAVIIGFYSCDAYGVPLDRFPKNSYAYFNETVKSLTNHTISVSIHLNAEDELYQEIGTDILDTTIGAGESASYIMRIFIPNWAFVGSAAAYASLWSGGMPIYTGSTTTFYIIPQDTVPPYLQILSPFNLTYQMDSVLLTYTVNERTSWTGYRLNSMPNVTITGNTTIRNLSNGSYNVTVSANDTSGNMGTSQPLWFTIQVYHDVAILSLGHSPDELFKGEVAEITLVVKNQGTMPENFNATLYANSTVLGEWQIDNLGPNAKTVLNMQWNTSDSQYGIHILTAELSTVAGETDLNDNTLTNGTVTILLRHEVAITNATLSKTILGREYPLTVNVSVRNPGDIDENVTLYLYANETVIANYPVILPTLNETVLAFEWNGNSLPTGDYSIIAFIPPFPDEVNTTDNTLNAGSVYLTIAGDLTSGTGLPDGKVDMRDIGAIAAGFGKTPSNPGWDPNKDVNGDLRVDLRDIGIACNNFGHTL